MVVNLVPEKDKVSGGHGGHGGENDGPIVGHTENFLSHLDQLEDLGLARWRGMM